MLVVSELTASAHYTDNTLAGQMHLRALRAVTTILERYGADYKVLSPLVARTEFCRIGVVTHLFGTPGAFTESFDAVIHVGFNGTHASQYTGYRPDSLTLTAKAPTVPQLMLLDEHDGTLNIGAFNNSTTCSTWVATNGYQPAGSGSGNHEGEGSVYVPDNDFRWFDIIYGAHILKKASDPTGGMRVLLAGGANATMTNLELTGNMPAFVDSLSTAVTDTMKVREKLNLHASGAKRVVFATTLASLNADSVSSADLGIPNTYWSQGVNWPVLLFAMAHLDSLSSGLVLGSKKPLTWGAVVVGAGTTSDRRHPGGFLLADSSIVAASCDSLGTQGVKVVVAADPESLTVRPWQVAIFNRIKNVRYAPWTRLGLDTLALGASGTSTLASPVDSWGRYRNRAIYGDSTSHTVNGSDTSIFANLKAARRILAAQVGQGKMSTLLFAPDFDWSPYQMRRGQNGRLLDSLLWLSAQLGGPLLVNAQDRDRDPTYSGTNPKGWLLNEGVYGSALAGPAVTVLGHNGMSVRGSRVGVMTDGLSFMGSTTDSLPPICSPGPCPGPNAAVYEENRFWNGFFGPSRDYSFNAHDGLGDTSSEGKYVDSKDRLYSNSRASLIVLPAQSLGGQSSTAPNRWGYFTLKHLMHVTKAINAKAGRTVIVNAFPKNIEP